MGIPMGIPVGMGWVWGLKCHPHGSPGILSGHYQIREEGLCRNLGKCISFLCKLNIVRYIGQCQYKRWLICKGNWCYNMLINLSYLSPISSLQKNCQNFPLLFPWCVCSIVYRPMVWTTLVGTSLPYLHNSSIYRPPMGTPSPKGGSQKLNSKLLQNRNSCQRLCKHYYTVSQKKHVTTFSTITLTISVRLQ